MLKRAIHSVWGRLRKVTFDLCLGAEKWEWIER